MANLLFKAQNYTNAEDVLDSKGITKSHTKKEVIA